MRSQQPLGLESSLSLSLLLAFSPSAALASGLATHDWPTLGGNSARNKISPNTNKNPLTIYIRKRPTHAASSFFEPGGGPAVVKDTIYAISANDNADGLHPPQLIAYELNGRQKWATNLSPFVGVAQSALAVADDGTIFTGNTTGLNAYNSSGTQIFTNACGSSNLRAPVIAKNGTVFMITGADGDIRACDPLTGIITNRTNEFPPGTGGGLNAGGPVISSGDIVYFQNLNGVHAVNASDLSKVWTGPVGNRKDNVLVLSPDEKYLGVTGADNFGVVNAKTGVGLGWNVRTGNSDTTFMFGIDDRIYISLTGTDLNGIPGIGVSIPRLCALDVVTSKPMWCYLTQNSLADTAMVVDSNNTVYLKDKGEHSFFALTADGKLQWKYIDSQGINSSDAPAMTDDGRLFYADDFLYGFRPWTLTPIALEKPAPTSIGVYFTVKSSMIRRDPQDGVTADNQVQVRLDGGGTIPLKYLHQEGDDSVWEGVYSIPASTDLSKVQLKGQIEAIANQTTSVLITHFASVPGGFNNTGMVQAFDLGSVDKLSGTAAQSSTTTPDDFTRAYQVSINWIRVTSLAAWSYMRGTYHQVADFVMR